MGKKITMPSKKQIIKPSGVHSQKIYFLAAFLEGGVVLSVEILGAKMLSPFFGTSLFVWTSVIGITVAFLTLGYYAGGRLSKRNDLTRLLSYTLSIAALLIILMPLWALSLYKMLFGISLYTGSLIAATLFLGPPMLALGITSPLIIQHLTNQVSDSGKTAGLVYAVSTSGGILFTFFMGFIAIPDWGISLPTVILSVILLLFSLYIFIEKKQYVIIFLFLICLVTFFSRTETAENPNISVPYMSEGLLGQLKVLDVIDPTSNMPQRYLLINGIPQTRIFNNETAVSDWTYVHRVAITASLKRNSPDVLLFGFGGGSIAGELRRMQMKTDAVEIDERMFGIARDYFYFNDSAITYTVDDARHYIRTKKKQYDLIIFDVLSGEVQPSYVFTRESFEELKKLLKPGGIIIIEFQELTDHKGISVYQSICNTFLESGFKAYTYKGQGPISDIIITASLSDIDFSGLKKEGLSFCCAAQPWVDKFLKKPNEKCEIAFQHARLLTDDKPMIDVLNAKTIKAWRNWSLNYFMKIELDQHIQVFK